MVGRPEILVLGGGVAGCIAAAMLARAGRSVTLITLPRRHSLFEGLSPRTADALRAAGCARALAAAGPFVPRVSHWNGERTQANGETLVDRRLLDAGLVADARAAGVDVTEARIEAVDETDGGWRVRAGDGGRREQTVEGRFLVEARGRQAPAAGRRRHGPPTTALVRRWRVPPDMPAGARVVSFADGWCWLAAPGDGRLDAQVVSASETVPAKPELEAFYNSRLADIDDIRPLLVDARPDGALVARNANVVLCEDIVGPRSIRLGDAAMALDPLSGQGQFQAASGALAAAAVIATLLDRPADHDLAERFHRERIEQAFLSQARVGRDFYRLEQRWPERPFWAARSAWPDDGAAHPDPAATAPRIETRPVIENGYVAAAEVVVTADHPRGVARIDGVPLVPLMRFLAGGWRGGTDLAAEAAARLDCPPARIGTALAWLESRGLLVARAADAP